MNISAKLIINIKISTAKIGNSKEIIDNTVAKIPKPIFTFFIFLTKGEKIPIIRRSIPINNNAIDKIRTTVKIPMLGKINTTPADIIETIPITISITLTDRFDESFEIST